MRTGGGYVKTKVKKQVFRASFRAQKQKNRRMVWSFFAPTAALPLLHILLSPLPVESSGFNAVRPVLVRLAGELVELTFRVTHLSYQRSKL